MGEGLLIFTARDAFACISVSLDVNVVYIGCGIERLSGTFTSSNNITAG
jgi:hypothetical protein